MPPKRKKKISAKEKRRSQEVVSQQLTKRELIAIEVLAPLVATGGISIEDAVQLALDSADALIAALESPST